MRFKDAELVCGYSLSYSPDRDGFFMFPADAGSNNLRVFVVTAAAMTVRAGPSAEEALANYSTLTQSGSSRAERGTSQKLNDHACDDWKSALRLRDPSLPLRMTTAQRIVPRSLCSMNSTI